MGKTNIEIAGLISKYLTESLTEEEKNTFDQWLAADERHGQMLDELRDRNEWSRRGEFLAGLDTAAAFDRLEGRIGSVRKPKRRALGWMRYAAAVAVLLVAGFTLWQLNHTRPVPNIMPGTSKAYLYTDDGMFLLEAGADQIIALESAQNIRFDGSGIVYDRLVAEGDNIRYNKLTTPRGGEFEINLSDGTRVWLNAETTLEYPAAFADDRREVSVSGEAFFEVAKDGRLFYVNTREATVEVLGTSFGVTCYPESPQTATVLETGSVRFSAGESSVVLQPGQRAVAGADGNIGVSDIDLRYHTAWRHGQYYFDNAPMSEIADALGRWYDIEFEFSDPSLAQKRFSGAVIRTNPLNFALNLFEQTQSLRFRVIDEKRVRIEKI